MFWTVMGRIIKVAIEREKPWCQMCRIGIFPGHGHVMKDGTKEEALIRWA